MGGGAQQLPRVREAQITFRIAAEQPSDLDDAGIAVDDARVGARDATLCAFLDDDVVVRARGDLRQVRDRKHLMMLGDTPHRVTHL